MAATALIVIDVQHAFDLWEAEGRPRNNPQAVARIVDLLGGFRALGLPVFHVRHASTDPRSRFWPSHAGYGVKAEAREHDGETVIVKHVNSAFIGTDLEAQLRASGLIRLVICGATTNHCVETTTRMAGNLGFEPMLVSDATWTFDRIGPDGALHRAADIQAMTLSNLNEEFATIRSTTDVLASIGRSA